MQSPRLIVVSESEHKFFEMAGICRIGRASESDIVLNDGLVSRRHTVIEQSGEKYIVRDLRSHNGTYLNGRRIREETLKSWDAVRIGHSIIFFVDPVEFAAGGPASSDSTTSSTNLRLAEEIAKSDSVYGEQALDMLFEDETARKAFERILRKERMRAASSIVKRVRRDSVPGLAPLIADYKVSGKRLGPVDGGGDFYSIERLPHGTYAYVGSIGGEGLGAAVTAISVRAVLTSILSISGDIDARTVFEKASEIFDRTLPPGTDLHLAIMKIEAESVSAHVVGCLSLLVRRDSGNVDTLRSAEDSMVGDALSLNVQLAKQEMLVCMSAGVAQSKSVIGEVFGTKSVRRMLRRSTEDDAAEVLENLTEAHAKHTVQALDRDATFLVLQRS